MTLRSYLAWRGAVIALGIWPALFWNAHCFDHRGDVASDYRGGEQADG